MIDWTDRCHVGDCREVLPRMMADGVRAQMCVTSPPYFGLRDYNTEGQIGLEQSPEFYVAKLIEVFRLVREVLADDGTLWIVIGDSYVSGGGTGHQGKHGQRCNRTHTQRALLSHMPAASGLKPKDLVGIPWRVAFALQADGWWLRSDIIWAKPNCMPESVTDRPTRSHEYIFLLSKSERYYYDHEAIQEPAQPDTLPRYLRGRSDHHKWADGGPGNQTLGRTLEHMAERAISRSGNKERKYRVDHGGNPDLANAHQGFGIPWEGNTRNKRSVWTIATEPYSEAHFATFPKRLVEPCILAGSRTGDIVLDPFLGSGTVAEVAQNLGRRWIGIDLNSDYERMQKRRTAQTSLVL